MKLWTYKSKRSREVGVIILVGRIYYNIPSRCLYMAGDCRSRKRRRLKENWISTFISFTYFPSDLYKPRHYLEVDQIYFHEIFRLLKKLR